MPVHIVAKVKNCSHAENASNSCVTIKDNNTIYIHKKDDDPITNDMIEMFKFHSILPCEATPNQIYEQILLNKIDQLKYGQNAVFICYGQYQSGKTYTLFGNNDDKNDQKTTMGLLPRALQHIFNIATQLTDHDRSYSVSMRILRICNDKLYDVLNYDKVKDNNIRITDKKNVKGRITWTQNANVIPINSIKDFKSIISKIINNGTLPAFNHIVYTLYLQYSINNSDKTMKTKQCIYSQIHFVELASSDKLTHFIQKKSHPLYPLPSNNKSMNINHQTKKFLHQTLESLVTVFTFIKQNAKFIPLRNTRLTHILKDCLSDSTSNIIIFLTVIPLQKYLNETLNTLRFGEQIYYQCIQTKSKQKTKKVNMVSSKNDTKEYQSSPSNIIQLLYEMKELISHPLKIQARDIENMHHRISDMIIYLRHSNHEMMHCKNMVHRLENENNMLREHIDKQNKVIIDFTKAIQCRQSHDENIHLEQSPKTNVDSKINDIEQRLKEHTSMLQSLQNECIQNIDDNMYNKNGDESSDLTLTEDIFDTIHKTQSNELEKILASRHNFETLNI